jgi:transcriptional regulator with XRE-family HTH domain
VRLGFGALLRAHRTAAGWSQEELSERAGLSLRTIGNLEQNRTRWPYRDTVRRLADGLNLDGPERAAFLSTAGRRRGPSTAADEQPHVMTPRQLPAAPRPFAGREAELTFLTSLLGGPESPAGRGVVIGAIGGTAGAGKTALAIQWAHQVAGQFPDGQLYVNLRGYDPDRQMPAGEALGGFLAALGVPGPQIPAGTEDRAAAFRSVLAGRRVLIVLDNARDAGQPDPPDGGWPVLDA